MEKISNQEALAWVKSREWANGWNADVDESVDAVEFGTQYKNNKALWDKLFSFLATTDFQSLEPGKIELVPGRLWINVLEYTPKDSDNTKIESHRKFIDLQYTFEGNEIMGLASDVTPIGDYDPVKDRTNYVTDKPIAYSKADPGRFFLYFPKDMHQPSVKGEGEAVPSRKIVGKIEYV